ncbi:C-factor-like [Oppia nitens]|uniref:C-factor-like n=1 Tax=Oppia nitens TaxID=1686743 RepID=UPI0023DB2F65|nr:C-factor-like [Oppia nitens]
MSFKSVLITGANRGIGLGLTRQLLSATEPPIHLIATTRQSTNPDLDQLVEQYPNLHVLKLEGKDYKSFDTFAKQVADIVGDHGLDVLINNAGIKFDQSLSDVSPEQMVENIEVNAVVPLFLTRSLLPVLRIASSKRKTLVINVTSMLGSIGMFDEISDFNISAYPYRASKAALNMITKQLSHDLKADNILVVGLHPGWLKTDMGGQEAPQEVDTTCADLLTVMRNVVSEHRGKIIDFRGNVLPY